MEAVTRFVYVAVDPPQCKIGHSKNPLNRAKWLYNPCHFPRRKKRPPIRRIWPVGEKAYAVEQAVIAALFLHCTAQSFEWFEIGAEEIYKAVDDCILKVVGTPIPGVKVSEATLRRLYL